MYQIAEDIPIFGPNCQNMKTWDGKNFRIHVSWTRLFENDRVKWRMTIPVGFVTDFGSIPRLGRRVWTPTGPYINDYLGHDGLYGGELVSRAEADYILLETLEYRGACLLDRRIQYSCVRAGGWYTWMRHDPKQVKRARESIIWEYELKTLVIISKG